MSGLDNMVQRCNMARPVKNLLGKKFNHWEVLNFSHICKHGDAKWVCQCDLYGKVYDIRSDSLQSGRSTKCTACAALERKYGYARAI